MRRMDLPAMSSPFLTVTNWACCELSSMTRHERGSPSVSLQAMPLTSFDLSPSGPSIRFSTCHDLISFATAGAAIAATMAKRQRMILQAALIGKLAVSKS